ncbi:MAG: hypothetical protein COC19_01115 [SAR86 cluster bacterium]|uniref:Transposase n=1 Tax=SAR86 cluster bacterium TaxID=2030880 RepID=A0A2A4MU34_9GAMM|nr:MAG: hypothetical protein COC19_01115 [SAR86 cluster bacterium]
MDMNKPKQQDTLANGSEASKSAKESSLYGQSGIDLKDYNINQIAEILAVRTDQLYRWLERFDQDRDGENLSNADREELLLLREEVKTLQYERHKLKRGIDRLTKKIN